MKRADAPASLTHHDDAWQSFLARRPGWAEKRLRDDGVLYCLPTSAVDEALKLYRLERDDQFAEDDLAALCAEHRAIGWTARGPLRYRLLDKPLPLPQIEGLEGLLKLGWGQEHIDWVRRGEVPRANVFHRLRAAAGRLVATKSFLDERDALRERWAALPGEERPPLPLRPPVDLSTLPPKMPATAVSAELAAFWDALAQLCGRWQVAEMTTWDLPDPEGPRWSSIFTPADLAKRGGVQIQTPWHFALHRSDGFGEVVEDHHARQAADHGVDDHGSWETYAHFVPLGHWETVLAKRYPKQVRARAFMTQLEPVLAAVVGVSPDRIQVLRKALAALQAGRSSSLRGRR